MNLKPFEKHLLKAVFAFALIVAVLASCAHCFGQESATEFLTDNGFYTADPADAALSEATGSDAIYHAGYGGLLVSSPRSHHHHYHSPYRQRYQYHNPYAPYYYGHGYYGQPQIIVVPPAPHGYWQSPGIYGRPYYRFPQ